MPQMGPPTRIVAGLPAGRPAPARGIAHPGHLGDQHRLPLEQASLLADRYAAQGEQQPATRWVRPRLVASTVQLASGVPPARRS